MSVDKSGRIILEHTTCVWCCRPSWDHFPHGVVALGYRCGYCGRRQPGLAVVAKIIAIEPHPNADRVELIFFEYGGSSGWFPGLVVGKHYRVGDRGIWLRPGSLIPGWLAQTLWLVGKNRAKNPFTVRAIEIRGVPSPGLWAGQWYRNDSSKESQLRADDLAMGGGQLVDGWISWAKWNPAWRIGDSVDGELDITPCPPSSVAEQPVVNRQVAAKTTASSRPLAGQGDAAVEALGSTPAVGSPFSPANDVDDGA